MLNRTNCRLGFVAGLRSEAVPVRREKNVVWERGVTRRTSVRIRKTIPVVRNRHLERVDLTAFRVAEARLDEHLHTGATEAVAGADQVIARHPLDAPRERSGETGLADRNGGAYASHELIGHRVVEAVGISRGLRVRRQPV